MKKAFIAILSIVLLFTSCDSGNIWQKMKITKKPELKITTPGIKEIAVIDNKIDIMKIFTSSSNLSLNIEMKEGFSGRVIKPQTRDELNTMAELLLSKAFSKTEVQNYLNSNINNEQIEDALRGNVQLLIATENSFQRFIDQIPLIEITDEKIDELLRKEGLEQTEENRTKVKETINSWNTYIKDVKENIRNLIDELFRPIKDFTSKNYTWGDYTRIQLTINIAGNFLTAIAKSFSEGSFNLDTTSGLESFFKSLENDSIKNVYNLSLNLIGELVTPLAGMDQITSRYGNIITMPNIKDIMHLFVERDK